MRWFFLLMLSMACADAVKPAAAPPPSPLTRVELSEHGVDAVIEVHGPAQVTSDYGDPPMLSLVAEGLQVDIFHAEPGTAAADMEQTLMSFGEATFEAKELLPDGWIVASSDPRRADVKELLVVAYSRSAAATCSARTEGKAGYAKVRRLCGSLRGRAASP